MLTIRVYPNAKVQEAILAAADSFERRVAEKIEKYASALVSGRRLIPTERREVMEIQV
jgi:hypothetical protein